MDRVMTRAHPHVHHPARMLWTHFEPENDVLTPTARHLPCVAALHPAYPASARGSAQRVAEHERGVNVSAGSGPPGKRHCTSAGNVPAGAPSGEA